MSHDFLPAPAPIEPLADGGDLAPRPDTPPRLQPETLGPDAQAAVRALMAAGESANTVRSYQSALRYWGAWYRLRYGGPVPMPTPEPVLLQFVVDHVPLPGPDGLASQLPPALDQALVDAGAKARTGPPALATLLHRVSVLSRLHQLQGLPNPAQAAGVRELLARARRANARRGALPARKPALTREPLQALLDTCDDSLRGVRDRALLLLAWASGGRRRSEVTDATVENLLPAGERAWVFRLPRSKTDQTGALGAAADKPVVGAAADALNAWLQRSGIRAGPVFRRVRHGGHLGEPLAPAAVRDIVRRRCALAGLPEDYSAHSLRSGFVTEAARQGIPIGETMAMTGHASVATVVGYFRSAEVLRSAAARLLDE